LIGSSDRLPITLVPVTPSRSRAGRPDCISAFARSTNCILYERATPVFVDIDEKSLNIDPRLAEAAMTDRTRAILPVHVFGQPCAMDELTDFSGKHDLLLIEDACEAIGAEYRGRKVGSFGKAAVFGFYPNKQMTMGEGGIITTSDTEWAEKFKHLRNQGRNAMGPWLHHEHLGFNYRVDEMSAALGLSQLSRVDESLENRSKLALIYGENLRDIPGVTLMSPIESTTRLSWFVFVIRLDEAIDRNDVINHLQSCGIPTRTYFAPIHLQPYLKEKYGYRKGDFPIAERVANSALALPFHSNLSYADIEYVATHLKEAIELATA
jgi:perosamine synthetase